MEQQGASAAPKTKGSLIRWARFYDPFARVVTFGREDFYRRLAIEAAQIAPGERLLDVGCGTGTLTLLAREAAGETGEVFGIDGSPEMIEVAREKAVKAREEIDFKVGLIETLPFPDGHFDLVLSSFMLHHLPDELKRDGFFEIKRVLKPGGRLLAVDLSGGGGTMFTFLSKLIGHGMASDYGEKLAGLIEEAGLRAEVLPSERSECTFIRATPKDRA